MDRGEGRGSTEAGIIGKTVRGVAFDWSAIIGLGFEENRIAKQIIKNERKLRV